MLFTDRGRCGCTRDHVNFQHERSQPHSKWFRTLDVRDAVGNIDYLNTSGTFLTKCETAIYERGSFFNFYLKCSTLRRFLISNQGYFIKTPLPLFICSYPMFFNIKCLICSDLCHIWPQGGSISERIQLEALFVFIVLAFWDNLCIKKERMPFICCLYGLYVC